MVKHSSVRSIFRGCILTRAALSKYYGFERAEIKMIVESAYASGQDLSTCFKDNGSRYSNLKAEIVQLSIVGEGKTMTKPYFIKVSQIPTLIDD